MPSRIDNFNQVSDPSHLVLAVTSIVAGCGIVLFLPDLMVLFFRLLLMHLFLIDFFLRTLDYFCPYRQSCGQWKQARARISTVFIPADGNERPEKEKPKQYKTSKQSAKGMVGIRFRLFYLLYCLTNRLLHPVSFVNQFDPFWICNIVLCPIAGSSCHFFKQLHSISAYYISYHRSSMPSASMIVPLFLVPTQLKYTVMPWSASVFWMLPLTPSSGSLPSVKWQVCLQLPCLQSFVGS